MHVDIIEIDTKTIHILIGKRELSTKQTDGPRYLQPQHKQRQSGKRTVDGVVARNPNLRVDIEQLQQLHGNTREDAWNNRTLKLHIGIRHGDIQPDEQQR